MAERELENLFSASLQGLRDMVDVNTIIGNPIETSDGTTIIPVSKVSFGFGMGGFDGAKNTEEEKKDSGFGGGSGGGVTINPVGFLVVSGGEVKMLNVDSTSSVEKIIEIIPELTKSISSLFGKNKD